MTRSRADRQIVALATYCLIAGASFFVLLRLCARCGTDNAYLGEVLLGLLTAGIGVAFGATWAAASRREGLSGLAAGLLPGVAVATVLVVIGSSRTLVPPALFPVELVLLVIGAVTTAVLARRNLVTQKRD